MSYGTLATGEYGHMRVKAYLSSHATIRAWDCNRQCYHSHKKKVKKPSESHHKIISGYNRIMRWICFAILINCLWASPSFAQKFPTFQPGEPITDVSGSLPREYLAEMQLKLQSYPFAVRAVYLPQTQGTHLGLYAARLFQHWDMPEDQMLVVIALDRRKIGVHAGQKLKARMKEEGLQDQEIPVPIASPVPGQTPDPTLPLDVSSEFDHLDLIPQAIDQVSSSLKETQDTRNPPRNGEQSDETVFDKYSAKRANTRSTTN